MDNKKKIWEIGDGSVINTLKYVAVAAIVGLMVGAIDALFARVLVAIGDFRTSHWPFLLPFLPLAGLFIIWIYRKVSKESLKGMGLVFSVGHEEEKKIPLLLIPLVMGTTWITHLFGGSAGREGVAVQIGATVSHNMGRLFKLPENAKAMLIAGMAAGFAGVFGTPFAAIFFAIEVLAVGLLNYKAFIPAIVASFVSAGTAYLLGVKHSSVIISQTLDIANVENVLKLLVLAISFAFAGWAFSTLLAFAKKFFADKFKNPYARIGLLSIPLTITLILLWGGRYSGLGSNLINLGLNNGEVFAFDWALKIVLTVTTLAIGFQGGEVTPLFSIGTTLGFTMGHLLGLDPLLAAALGYIAVFGAATNTLLAPIVIGLEIFGPSNALAFIIVCGVAFIFNGNKSIYGGQKAAFLKI